MSDDSKATTESTKRASAGALRLLDVLFLRNPERTAVGATLGFALHGAFGVFQPLISAKGFPLGDWEWWASMSTGVVLVHLPFILWSVRTRPLISDELDALIELIESTNIGALEKRTAYRRVVNKCIEEFSLSVPPGQTRAVLLNELKAAEDQTDTVT